MGAYQPIPHVQGGYCQKCKRKAKAFERVQESRIEEADTLFQWVLAQDVALSRHLQQRCFERCFSLTRLKACLADGLPISLSKVGTASHLVVLSAIKEGKTYRPIHLCLVVDNNGIMIKTVYDPRSKKHQWDATFSIRKCWCQEGTLDEKQHIG